MKNNHYKFNSYGQNFIKSENSTMNFATIYTNIYWPSNPRIRLQWLVIRCHFFGRHRRNHDQTIDHGTSCSFLLIHQMKARKPLFGRFVISGGACQQKGEARGTLGLQCVWDLQPIGRHRGVQYKQSVTHTAAYVAMKVKVWTWINM